MDGAGKKRNKTFYATEKKILKATSRLCRKAGPFSLAMRQVAREAGVAESTLYNHCRKIGDLLNFRRDQVISNVNQLPRLEQSAESVFQQFLVVCYRDREMIEIILATDGPIRVSEWTHTLKPVVICLWPRYTRPRQQAIFRYFQVMAVGEILNWQKDNFPKYQISRRARHLVWIAKNAPKIYNNMTRGEDSVI